jgi:hypothetical protein
MGDDRQVGILALSHLFRDLDVQLVRGLQIRHCYIISSKVAQIKRTGK